MRDALSDQPEATQVSEFDHPLITAHRTGAPRYEVPRR
jgi:hypothetical protein